MPEPDIAAPRGTTARPLILVVDDDALIRHALRETLEAAEFSVAEAASGPEGLALVNELQPELVLLDTQMPGSDGLEICRVLRERPVSRYLPVVMMTEGYDPTALQEALDVGASDFLAKPIDTVLLGHRLRFLLRADRTMKELRESQARLNQTQRLARLGSWEWPAGSERLELSDEAAHLYGLDDLQVPVEVLLGKVASEDRSRVEKALAEARHEGTPFALDHRVRLADGGMRYLHSQGLVGEAGSNGEFVLKGTSQDISERRRTEEKIHYLAHYDPLTGLPNRLLFNELLAYIIAYARRQRHQLALLFLDLDHFKTINQSLGHRAGDELLRQVAERLKGVIRKTDFIARQTRDEFPQSVARLGGDEFSIWLPGVEEIQDVVKVLRRIHQALEDPFSLEGQEIIISSSIGVAFYPQDGADVETLLENAETAMHHAKQESHDPYHFYSGSMNSAARRLLTMEENLHRSLEANEMLLYFQPQLELASGRIVGAEVTLRWPYPGEGLVMPGELLPLAEGSGMITQLGEWALHAVCSQARRWQEQGLPPLRVTINLSSHRLWKESLATSIARVLAETDFDPCWLHLELTESILRQNRAGILSTLNFLRNLGVGITLGDFGTGYSSLAHFKHLPLDDLKIDQTFIRDLPERHEAAAIVRAVINLGHSLGLRVIAEGVENEAQVATLQAGGCDCIQGLMVTGPLPAGEFVRFWGNWRQDSLPAVFRATAGTPEGDGATGPRPD